MKEKSRNSPFSNKKLLALNIVIASVLLSVVTYIFIGSAFANIGIIISLIIGTVLGVIGVTLTGILMPFIKSIFGE